MRSKLEKWLEKIVKQLSSIKLAVFIISAIAVLSAIGTVYEAKYDAQYAQKMVYHSIYMNAVLSLLCINLIFVMVDRWPWKKHHTGFVLAHIGIILTLLGAWVTQKFGIDGSMSFPLGEANRYVTIPDQEINIFSSFIEGQPTRVFSQPIDFFKKRPSQDKPFIIPLGQQEMKVLDYYHYAIGKEEYISGDKLSSGPALRMQLQNEFVNMTQWLFKPPGKSVETVNLGPAQIVIHDGSYKYKAGNVMTFRPLENGELAYEVFLDRTKGLVKAGTVKAGESFDTGWMGASLRLLKYLPQAQRKVQFVQRKTPTPRTRSAILVEFKDEKHWVGLNSVVKFFDQDKVFYFSFGNRRIDVGFDIQLADFRVGKYQGTNRAMSYESLVKVPELGEVLISMNEPMKHKGLTFYQASFEQDENGNPTTSILSVNKDPGRPIKYLGSFLIVLGSIVLFYFKRMKFKELFK